MRKRAMISGIKCINWCIIVEPLQNNIIIDLKIKF